MSMKKCTVYELLNYAMAVNVLAELKAKDTTTLYNLHDLRKKLSGALEPFNETRQKLLDEFMDETTRNIKEGKSQAELDKAFQELLQVTVPFTCNARVRWNNFVWNDAKIIPAQLASLCIAGYLVLPELEAPVINKAMAAEAAAKQAPYVNLGSKPIRATAFGIIEVMETIIDYFSRATTPIPPTQEVEYKIWPLNMKQLEELTDSSGKKPSLNEVIAFMGEDYAEKYFEEANKQEIEAMITEVTPVVGEVVK